MPFHRIVEYVQQYLDPIHLYSINHVVERDAGKAKEPQVTLPAATQS